MKKILSLFFCLIVFQACNLETVDNIDVSKELSQDFYEIKIQEYTREYNNLVNNIQSNPRDSINKINDVLKKMVDLKGPNKKKDIEEKFDIVINKFASLYDNVLVYLEDQKKYQKEISEFKNNYNNIYKELELVVKEYGFNQKTSSLLIGFE